MDNLKSSISIIYQIQAKQLSELKSIFKNLGFNDDKGNGERNYLDIVKNYTRVYKFTLKNEKINDNAILNSIFLGSFFKSRSDQLLDIKETSLHIRYINDFDEVKVTRLTGAIGKDNINNFKGLASNHYTLFVNAKNNIAVEYCNKKASNTIENVNIFLMAIAYRDYYKNKNEITIEKADKINLNKVEKDDYQELLKFSTQISRNDAIYFFKNPTNALDYETYYEKLKINESHDEFINGLTNLFTAIKLIREWEDWKFKNKWEKIGYFVAIVGLSATIVGAWAAVLAIP